MPGGTAGPFFGPVDDVVDVDVGGIDDDEVVNDGVWIFVDDGCRFEAVCCCCDCDCGCCC